MRKPLDWFGLTFSITMVAFFLTLSFGSKGAFGAFSGLFLALFFAGLTAVFASIITNNEGE